MTQGASVSNTITASLVSGTSKSVSYSVKGLPSSTTTTFSKNSCTPTCSTTLTLTTSSTTPVGSYSVAITGTGGGKTRTTSFGLTVSQDNQLGDYYVDVNHPNASDQNSGTKSWPFKTIQKAANIAKAGGHGDCEGWNLYGYGW